MGNIITLDVSLRATGFAVVDARSKPERLLTTGYIPTKPDRKQSRTADDIRSVSIIVEKLQELITRWKPALVVAELPCWSQSSRGAVAQGISVGVLGAVRQISSTPCVWITPQETKIGATGIKNASKSQVQAGILKVWPELTWKNNAEKEAVCDALGALIYARNADLYLMASQL